VPVLARFTLLACWALCTGWGIGNFPTFGQLVDASGQHYFDDAETIINTQLADLLKSIPELKGLEPAQNQQGLSGILDNVGKRLEASLQALPNTSSREDITEQKLSGKGHLEAQRVDSFNFLILVRHGAGNGGGAETEEYRTPLENNSAAQQNAGSEFSLTRGFSNQWAHFYSGNRSASNFRLLGTQKLQGHETYVVAFAQRPGWASVEGRVVSNGRTVVILYQGIAWINVTGFQILRLRTDLLAPRKDIDLKRQTTEIEFGEVSFPQIASPLWLPRDVWVTTETRGRIERTEVRGAGVYTLEIPELTFRNWHHYSDFQLFRARSTIKPIEPGPGLPTN
jgi:hypothetical protein